MKKNKIWVTHSTQQQRPPVEYLVQFITKYHDWLIPDILGEGSPLVLAKMLVGWKLHNIQ
ncbi:hypothetical protein ACTXT7_003177 [Hymenolepis weldensis]